MLPVKNMPAPSLSNDEEVAEFKEQMMLFQRALARSEAARSNSITSAQDGSLDPNSKPSEEVVKAEIIGFKAPSGIKIKMAANGSISATNSDMNMTGKSILIRAQRTDGAEENISIIVPAPGN